MTIALAVSAEKEKIEKYDCHIPSDRLDACIQNQLVYVLKDGAGEIVGVLRYNLFWQTIPFLDLLYLDEKYRGIGYGTLLMEHWERLMRQRSYRYVLLSTQEDETAKFFYEKLGYQKAGNFLPPEQEAKELIYCKNI